MPFHKKISRIVRKAIPKEIAPFVAPVAGMALGPIAGSFLGGLGGTLAAKGGIGSLIGKALSNQMVSQGLGRALVDVGTQALTSDRISPASALLSGGLGALSGYQGLPELKQGQVPRFAGSPSKLRIGLDKALKQGAKLGRVGNLGEDFDLLSAAKMANVGGTLKAADDELAAEKKRQALARAKNEAFFEADNASRRQSIIESMMLAGFTRLEGEQAAAEEGYAMGGRVGFERGGGANEEAMAEMMMKLDSDEFFIDEDGNIRRLPKKRPRQNTRPGMNEEMMFDLMRRMELNRMGRKDGGTVPGLPEGRQVDAREGTFIPMGGAKRADDVPAMLSVNEFVLNDDAVAGLGKLMTGSPDPRAGARALYKIQDQLEAMV